MTTRWINQSNGTQDIGNARTWRRSLPGLFSSNDARHLLTRVVALLGGAMLPMAAWAATPPGTPISNTASVGYADVSGNPRAVSSNAVQIVSKIVRTPSTVGFVRVTSGAGDFMAPPGPTRCNTGSGFVALPPPQLSDGTSLNVMTPLPLSHAEFFHQGEALFIQVEDPDQNLDDNVAESVNVQLEVALSGDLEIVQLTESASDSGLFVGYIPSEAPAGSRQDCMLQVLSGARVSVMYSDASDTTDVTSAQALVDPVGHVFDSNTGMPVDNAIVRLIDVISGLPATVLGDDGVSEFPAELVSGGVATDSGGTDYDFGPGEFRFPLVAPGQYRLDITAPIGFAAPSMAAVIDLQALPGGPFNLGPGSFGDPFAVNPGPAIQIDVPLDPVSTNLFLQKTTTSAIASLGDFVKFTLTLENVDPNRSVDNVEIIDTLPLGMQLAPGSVRVDGAAVPDPAITSAQRELRFDVGELSAGAQTRIEYVTEIAAGSRGPELVNSAVAVAPGGVESNKATATIRLAEALFRTRSTLLGRVIDGSCDNDVRNDKDGVAGVRIYLQDGRYAVTDEGGRYHFEGLEPGTHVVQMDVDTVPDAYEVVPCERNARFAGRAYSQFVSLRPGALWRADFHLRAIPAGRGAVALSLTSASAAQDIIYTLTASGSGVPVSNVRIMTMLPDGLIYLPGSAWQDNTRIDDPVVNNSLLTFTLPDQGAVAWQNVLRFRGLPGQAAGEHITKALVSFDTPTAKRQRTPLAENTFLRLPPATERVDYVFTTSFDVRKATLKARDRAQIADALTQWRDATGIQVRVVGHTDATPIAVQNRTEFADNYVLSRARAQAAGRFIQELLSIPPSQLTLDGVGPDQPLVANDTADSRARNRRVEVQVWGELPVAPGAINLAKRDSGIQSLSVTAVTPTAADTHTEADDDDGTELFSDPDWVNQLQAGADLLMPVADYNPPIPSLKIAVKHAPRQTVELTLNGQPVSALNFEGSSNNRDRTVALSRWRGVDLQENDNLLIAVIHNEDGTLAKRVERNVHLSGGPVRAEIDTGLSHLVADGRNKPVLAVRLYDRWGKPARPESVGSYRVEAPYRAWWEVQSLRDNQLLAVGSRDPVYRVGADGVARIELEPTSRTGEVVLQMEYANQQEEQLRTWLQPAARDWILVGFAEGTAGYSTIKDNMRNAGDAGFEDDFYTDGQVAFFAKGRIKGDFLLTVAYDSDRDEREARDRLHGTIDPDRYYTLYGDATEQQFEAATQDELFLRLERGQFYAMFGDYDTGLKVTELSRYDRSFNGLRSEYQGERFEYSAFAARSDQSFVKDELRGDGTSGLYRLSRQPIVINSEKVTIETRDRFRSEDIVSSRTLTRYLDYDIDYLAGTLFFKQPVTHRDEGFNPVFIVIDYESRDPVKRSTTAGGRASLQLADGRVELGTSAIREGVSGADGDLYGLDLKVQLGAGTELRAEYARSDTRQDNVAVDGDAAIAELRHTAGRVDGRAYYRELDTGFGLGQQRGAETGTRKMGIDGRLRFSERLSLEAEVYRHDNLVTDARRDVSQGQLRWQGGSTTAGVGLRNAQDKQPDGSHADSSQAFVNGSMKALDDRLTLRASLDTDLGDNANIAYPARTVLGLDYELSDAVTLYTEHERANGDQIDTQLTRMGVRATPWSRAQINTGVTQQMTEYGPRAFANLGLIQGWQVNERLALDFGVDHSNTITGPGVIAYNEDAGFVSGDAGSDFTSLYLGSLYRSDDLTINGRAEWRNADAERRAGLYAGFYREQRQGRAFSAALQLFDTVRDSGVDLLNADLQLSWAYRPAESRWIFLDRLDLRHEDLVAPDTTQTSWRIVNNLHGNWMINRRNQLGIQYGVKYVRTTIDDTNYNGFTDLAGIDWRRDFSDRWDVGVQGAILHSWNADVVEYSIGADVGYTFMRNVWLSLGYNFAGFDDQDFSDARYTARGPYVRFRIKADQDNLLNRDFFARHSEQPTPQ